MLDDIYVWPDGTWCYAEELDEYGHMSDDYVIIYFDTADYYEFLDDSLYNSP